MPKYIFKSKRLGFRKWQEYDLQPFAKMNKDTRVMEFFPKTLTKIESDNFVKKIEKHFEDFGYGLYAVDVLADKKFIGFIGFMQPSFEAFFTPCIEIGWRIQHEFWGNGYATEGALRCLKYGFEELNFKEIYSFTATINAKSENVMQKIGMTKIGAFEHPFLENLSLLKTHVLYKINS